MRMSSLKLGIKVTEEDVAFDTLEDWVWYQLKRCYDPEIPVNIVDLGLIYRTDIASQVVTIDMTLTAAGCGMGPNIIEMVKRKVGRSEQVKEVHVNLVFDPPWTQDLMSDEAKLTLGHDVKELTYGVIKLKLKLKHCCRVAAIKEQYAEQSK